MVELVVLGPILTFVFLIIVVLVVVLLGQGIVWLIINSIIGIIGLVLVNLIPNFVNIPINVWSVLIVAFGGIPGFVLLILLDVLKLAF